MVALVGDSSLEGGFGDEEWYLDGIGSEEFLDCSDEGLEEGLIAGVKDNWEWKVE